MLKVVIQAEAKEYWDDDKQEFIYESEIKPIEVTLEHSLISLSKWESKWHKPYIGRQLSSEEAMDYVRCMCLTQNVPEEIFTRVPADVLEKVADYIGDPMTATWFTEDKLDGGPKKTGKLRGDVVTAEILYYHMITLNIPMECQKWHLNRLITLIRVISEKNAPPKKMSKSDVARRYSQLNAQRRAAMHTKG